MSVAREAKQALVQKISEDIKNAHQVIAWKYHGLSANEISEIRLKILEAKAKNVVYKNRLVKLAFKENKKEEINEHLTGPNSFLFTFEEDSVALKNLYKFIKANKKISFNAGYVNNDFYDGERLLELASLPSKEELLSMLLSVLNSSVRSLACTISQIKPKE